MVYQKNRVRGEKGVELTNNHLDSLADRIGVNLSSLLPKEIPSHLNSAYFIGYLNLERINNLEEEIGNEKFNPNELEIKLKVYPFVLSDLGNLGNSSGSQGIPNYKRIFPTVFEGRVSKTFLKSIGVNISEYSDKK